MIQSISISNVATYADDIAEKLYDLRNVNYIFGSNGTGKTTISRIINENRCDGDCSVTWKDGQPLERFVLNRDFVNKNYGQFRGVFTLGEEQKSTEEQIAKAKEESDKENDKLAGLHRTLDGDAQNIGKNDELEQHEKDFQDQCWAQKQKYDKSFYDAFDKLHKSKRRFAEKLLKEEQSNEAPSKDQSDLEQRAEKLFGQAPTKQELIPALDATDVLAHEANPILKKKVVGKVDVDIAAMIVKLGNSDWVRQGRQYYIENDQICPFCQQITDKAFAASLSEYFDETYDADKRAIDELANAYEIDSTWLQKQIEKVVAAPGQFLDIQQFKSQKALFDERIDTNKRLIEDKKKEPSKPIEMESLDSILQTINKLVDAANNDVFQHNQMVDNLDTEQQILKAEVWRLVLNELEVNLNQYHDTKNKLEKAIDGIKRNRQETVNRIKKIESDINNLEGIRTSIQPTIDQINKTLSSFGFWGFKLAMGGDEQSYKLVRRDGQDASSTLSEGERAFVVFLYFYHLIKGSFSESGTATDRVVVFDDPVTSMDSDVLFIVSTLVRDVCKDAKQNNGSVKQVFVMTHNVYFHKEVTLNPKRAVNTVLNNESFWMVRKPELHSKVELKDFNPVCTTYEMLWMEVKKADQTPWIQNTLRRILEYYFTILGFWKLDDLCNLFEGYDKLICRSLISWMHAGSHSVLDDVHVTPSDPQRYLNVFEDIFRKTNHGEHYDMMMGNTS